MAKFGLACEGITDHIVIENILCGFYKDYDDLDEDIQAFQPAYDETTKKQKEDQHGGWEILLEYLSEKRFRDDVLNSEYVIVQIDTDISDHTNFGVQKDTSCIETFINNISTRLIESIDDKISFYEENKEKIIFAISVHSLECWLLTIYKKDEINNCFKRLQREDQKLEVIKNYKSYEKLSKPFVKNKDLVKYISKNKSLEVFTNSLPII
ncbi:MAG: phage tail protein [Campylobacterota bacterium]|nr:phage tail protein [Campylobacterota bacterium]